MTMYEIIIIIIIIIIIMIMIIIIMMINDNIPETRKYWVDVQQGIVSSHWERDALVGNPPRDGVSIKILLWRHLKSNPLLL